MRRSERAPEKRLPPLLVRLLLQAMRSVDVEAGGSIMVTAEAKTSAPSRKAESV
jgi:hypothetical protein